MLRLRLEQRVDARVKLRLQPHDLDGALRALGATGGQPTFPGFRRGFTDWKEQGASIR